MENKIEKIFSNLDIWRKLPKYQLERRLDIFFTIYLKEIVEVFYKEILNEKDIKLSEVIIPEFPLKKDDVANEDKTLTRVFSSTNVDYVMFCEHKSKCIFIELKTDIDSVDDEQFNYLTKAKDKKWNQIFEEVKKIEQHSGSSKKYTDLVNHINEQGKRIKDFSKLHEIDVIYIHPIATKITKDKTEFNSINFDFIVKNLSKEKDIISESFSKILQKIYTDSLERNDKKKRKISIPNYLLILKLLTTKQTKLLHKVLRDIESCLSIKSDKSWFRQFKYAFPHDTKNAPSVRFLHKEFLTTNQFL